MQSIAGQRVWRLSLTASMPVAMTATQGVLLVSVLSDRTLRAISQASHKEMWTFATKDRLEQFARAPIPVLSGAVVCVASDRRLIRLDVATGRMQWTSSPRPYTP